jgi:hypothetical protein
MPFPPSKLNTVVNVCAGNDAGAQSQSTAKSTDIPEFLMVDICLSLVDGITWLGSREAARASR